MAKHFRHLNKNQSFYIYNKQTHYNCYNKRKITVYFKVNYCNKNFFFQSFTPGLGYTSDGFFNCVYCLCVQQILLLKTRMRCTHPERWWQIWRHPGTFWWTFWRCPPGLEITWQRPCTGSHSPRTRPKTITQSQFR